MSERRPILRLEPGEPWARGREAVEFAEEGDCESAQVAIKEAQRLVNDGNFRMASHVGPVLWLCGERPRARALVEELKRHPEAHEHGYHIAVVHAAFGEKDSAFTWLDRHRWTMAELTALSADQQMDPLRSDPRFATALRRVGIRRL
jgi:hypothetical protein